MRRSIAAFGVLLLLGTTAAYSAENESRTYGNPSCSDRNAKPGDCVIQDGPPRRRGQVDPPAAPPKAGTAGSTSGGVTVLGGEKQNPSGR